MTMRYADVILEGVKDSEVAQLRALAAGRATGGAALLQPLEDKGWIETVQGVALITLTGRTLIETAPHLAR